MPADQDNLPSDYGVNDIIGVTKGSDRPTVYFKDGGRFTQKHGKSNNIGFHKPPAEGYLFFGNVDRALAKKVRAGADQAVQEFLRNHPGEDRPSAPAQAPSENACLLEIKKDSSRSRGYRRHVSRSALDPIGEQERQDVFRAVRYRSTFKEQDQGSRGEVLWQFKDKSLGDYLKATIEARRPAFEDDFDE
jgi:hypothetical protein